MSYRHPNLTLPKLSVPLHAPRTRGLRHDARLMRGPEQLLRLGTRLALGEMMECKLFCYRWTASSEQQCTLGPRQGTWHDAAQGHETICVQPKMDTRNSCFIQPTPALNGQKPRSTWVSTRVLHDTERPLAKQEGPGLDTGTHGQKTGVGSLCCPAVDDDDDGTAEAFR